MRIETESYFGDAKNLGGGLAELRWKNGRRVYFTKINNQHDDPVIVLISGGHKNAQKKDIKEARLFLRRHAIDQTE